MFQILMIIGWAALFVVLLYIWADVREIATIVKESKRELIRSNFGGRTSGKQQQNPWQNSVSLGQVPEKFREEPQVLVSQESKDEPKPWKRAVNLAVSEEQILQEVLTEFLG